MHRVVRYAITGLVVLLVMLPAIVCATPVNSPNFTTVEMKFIAHSGRQATYPHELIPVIEAKNQYQLGKLTALRFIEWAQHNPNGVIALTSGNTPEYFIKYLYYYKKNWHKLPVQLELHGMGIKSKCFPDTSNMKFVQLEEYFPISPKHSKNVTNYIKNQYLKLFNIRKENTLLMDPTSKGILAEKGMKVVFMSGKIDMSVMNRAPSSQLEVWQQQAIREARVFCEEYERKIRAWGGIDFFLGGLSYNGNLGFNPPGTAEDSKTHIVKLDYITAAHAAKELGGIEHAKGKVAITVGIGTLTIKPNAVLIILTAGDSKASIVRDAVETPSTIKHPASLLQKYPNSRMYINTSAAQLLTDRRMDDLSKNIKHGLTQQQSEEIIIDIALAQKKQIVALTQSDFNKFERGRILLKNSPQPFVEMLLTARNSLIRKIDNGLKLGLTKQHKILHTAPHHDDILLGYYPIIDNFLNNSQNKFAYVTSGFNSVTDAYILATINRASDWWLNKEKDAIFNKSYDKVIGKFKNLYSRQSQEQINMLDTLIALRHLVSIYDIKNLDQLKHTIRWLKDEYFPNKQPGDMDVASIKMLKGMIRESEADRLLSLKNISLENIIHLRSKFYSGKDFFKTPRNDTDVEPFVNVYNAFQPDVITVQDDPQSAPPITHYKVRQIIAQALRHHEAVRKDNLQIWGYRNIWFKYKTYEANVFVPVTAKMLDAQKRAFESCYNTQKSASFPSPFFEGDFPQLSAIIQKDQLQDLKILLGTEYFTKNPTPELRNAAGFIYLRQMKLKEFLQDANELQQLAELEDVFEVAFNGRNIS